MRFFSDAKLIALISDQAMDFTPADFDAPLTASQQEYLKKQTGIDIDHVFWRKQVHGDEVLVAQGSSMASFGLPDADAVITLQKNLPIAIRTADCVPVFLYDPTRPAIGLAHAGWKGTYQEIAYKTVQRMTQEFGCQPKNIQAVLGPSIQSCCYQVGEEFKQYFPQEMTQREGKLYVDVAQNNYRQLLKAGLSEANIVRSGECTCCGSKYYSFRRDAQRAGRMISLMLLL